MRKLLFILFVFLYFSFSVCFAVNFPSVLEFQNIAHYKVEEKDVKDPSLSKNVATYFPAGQNETNWQSKLEVGLLPELDNPPKYAQLLVKSMYERTGQKAIVQEKINGNPNDNLFAFVGVKRAKDEDSFFLTVIRIKKNPKANGSIILQYSARQHQVVTDKNPSQGIFKIGHIFNEIKKFPIEGIAK